ncbi:MAG: hypothetical protein IPP66_22310 [Anaerolineales bacterium]|nr:hypothetical protein [Anaerolineales bacterium]
MFNFRSSKMLVIVLVVLVFATTAFAFAATNTVPATYAGEGSSTTSGYTVTNIVYNLNATTPSNIDSVTFSLNAAANTVKIRLVTTGSYYSCSATNAPTNTNWSCTTTGATVSAANELRVIATE